MEDFDNSATLTEQGLLQAKPETSRDEQLAFIDTLRDIQGTQNREIQDVTHALGSDLPPQLGGINGTNSYWLNRYQTPQTESRVATLRTAAQSSALNTALNNYLNRLREDYNNAYRKANKRQRNRSLYGGSDGSGGGGGSGGSTDYYEPVIETEAIDAVEGNAPDTLSATTKGLKKGETYTTTKNGGYTTQTDSKGNITYTNNPAYTKASRDGYYYNTSGFQSDNLIANIVNTIEFGNKENLANYYAKHPEKYKEYLQQTRKR